MRSAPLVLAAAIALFGAAPLFAQEQERGLKDRLLNPDENLAFKGWKNGFYAGKSSFQATSAHVKAFQFEQKFRAKDYVTRDFLGTRGAWEGEFIYETKVANTEGRYIIPKKDTEYATETVSSEKARDSGKKARTNEYQTNKVELRGKSQKALDQQYNNDKQGLSIDDVRELLNKSK